MDNAFGVAKEKDFMKKYIFFLSLCFSIILIISCGVQKEKYVLLENENTDLKKQIIQLTEEIDELKNGEERTIAIIEDANKIGDYKTVRTNIEILKVKHPESKKNADYQKLLEVISQKEAEIQKKKEAEEKEQLRLANINNTGMWDIRYYVDSFNEPTKERYIANDELIKGTFENSATSNSDLTVQILITSSNDISIKLYEYADNNEVKGSYNYPTSYFVYVKDSEDKKYILNAKNKSDRLEFNASDSLILHKLFLKGKIIKFYIREFEGSSIYNFNILNPEWYDNAYRKLTGK